MQWTKIRTDYVFNYELKNALKYKDYIQRLPSKIPMYIDYLDDLVPSWIENQTAKTIITSYLRVV